MIINQPKLIVKDNDCIIETVFEINGVIDTIWYKVSREYENFISIDKVDAALVALFPLAMKNKEDIYLKGKVSSKLFYGLSTYLIKVIDLGYPEYESIKIYPETLSDVVYDNGNAAATGVSCGIDSFATIATHQHIGGNYHIKYLTYFNAGSHGVFGGEIAQSIYDKRLLKVKEFSKNEGFPLILLSSNIMEVIKVNFQSLHTLIHISCILNLQKGINVYYYASSFRFDYYSIEGINSSWDILILNFLETESINFYSSASQYTRLERTKLVAEYEPSYQFLDVCTVYQNSEKINCSACEKCVRTQFSLELLGKLENYKKVFDFEVYKKHKDNFIIQLISTKNLNQTNRELYALIKNDNQIKLKHYFLSKTRMWRKVIYRISLKFIKKKLIFKLFLTRTIKNCTLAKSP